MIFCLEDTFKKASLQNADVGGRSFHLILVHLYNIAEPFNEQPDLLIHGIDNDIATLIVQDHGREPKFISQINYSYNLAPQVQNASDIFLRLWYRCPIQELVDFLDFQDIDAAQRRSHIKGGQLQDFIGFSGWRRLLYHYVFSLLSG